MRNIIIVLITVVLISCTTSQKTNLPKDEGIKNQWELITLNGKEIKSDAPVQIEFAEDNRVSGHIGCNQMVGTYTINNAKELSFSQIGTTRMLCAEAQMIIEDQMQDVLNRTKKFAIKGNTLTLLSDSKSVLATFRTTK